MRYGGFVASVAVVIGMAIAPAAHAYEFKTKMKPGRTGPDVKALQVRIAGWYPSRKQHTFAIDGAYGTQTTGAMRAFEAAYGRPVNGAASMKDLQVLMNLESPDHSTKHFDFREFTQNSSGSCGSKANSYAGTFAGGRSQPKLVKRNVRRLMWRMEAVRKKGGSKPVGINSGFRSVPYNDCIGGARASQHLYGTAADNRMVGVDNRKERNIAKRSQVHGIGCYSSQSHNHFDLRIDNKDLEAGHFWWWPKRDSRGRDLADDGKACWGEKSRTTTARGTGQPLSRTTTALILREVTQAVPGAGSLLPSFAEVEAFVEAGEVADLAGAD